MLSILTNLEFKEHYDPSKIVLHNFTDLYLWSNILGDAGEQGEKGETGEIDFIPSPPIIIKELETVYMFWCVYI